MANATWAIPSFLGGEISAFAQGRFDKPDYKISMSLCLNSFPVEIGPWTRRPGTRHASTTRGGGPGRVMKFDFKQSNAVTLEFTDGYLRFRSGAALIPTNDVTFVTAVSGTNPAVVTVHGAPNWPTGATVLFTSNCSDPLLADRPILITRVDASNFSIADASTGAAIDGAALNGGGVNGNVSRVHELVTPYIGGTWSSARAVQAETTDILLAPSVAPQALTVTTLPSTGVNPQFAIAPATFNDGPYLDPFTNGVQATPGTLSGIVTITLAFPTYSSTKAYSTGSFVTSVGVNYISLQDQNVNNTPAISPTFWTPTSANAAINDGRGFLGTDIGRLVRLLSEPVQWLVATAYVTGNIVAYNPSGQDGATLYYQALANSTGVAPGSNLTSWQIIPQGAAIWTWGKIVALSNIIDRALAGSASIGDMAGGGGINSVFDGVFSKDFASSAEASVTGGPIATGQNITVTSYVGKNYSGAADQKIQQVTIYPSSDLGFAFGNYVVGGIGSRFNTTTTFNLRGKASVPGSSSDGTLLGTFSTANTFSAVTIVSTDQLTAWKYVWVEIITVGFLGGGPVATSYALSNAIAQISFFNPASSASSSAGAQIEILGPPLLYTNPILTWRLGVYSNTTGWPTCGTYHEGRLWLGGAVANRFDACVSNGILGGTVNFSPTNQYGVVAANSALTYTLNSDSVNPMFWMKPDLQGVVIGTQAGEWLVQAPTNGPISAANIAARRMTKYGSANVEPVRTENANIFVKRYARKLLEYFSDAYSGKYSAPNLADKAGKMVSAGIAELAYVEAVTPIVWMRDAVGALFGCTYRRSTISTQQPPDFYAWHRHTLGSGRAVESICTGPSVGGDLDALAMVTNDTTTNIRHVEVLTDTPDEDAALSDAWFLDDAVSPTAIIDNLTSVTIVGLWHLNGKTVQVFAGGLDCGDRGDYTTTFTDFVVSNGAVTIPYGDGIGAGPGRGLFTSIFVHALPLSQIVVGITYNSDGQLVRPIAVADTGARSGPALGLIRRNHRYAMLLNATRGLSVGASFSTALYPVRLTNDRGDTIPTLSTYSGIVQDPVNDTFSYEGGLCWRVSRPFPANIVAMSGNIKTQDQ